MGNHRAGRYRCPQSAPSPRSSLRMRMHFIHRERKILPSPILPVRAAPKIACTALSTMGSEHHFDLCLGNQIHAVFAAAIELGVAFLAPWPRTSITVMPSTPISCSASLTASSLEGLNDCFHLRHHFCNPFLSSRMLASIRGAQPALCRRLPIVSLFAVLREIQPWTSCSSETRSPIVRSTI